ncbi:MAG TPA: hypothetical protein VFQ85_11850 [Mycobacteriales bacterium]|jgi:uncharacterized integral membrane protein|nr:hypothetical protein [Mycobacteriales bacterium]
MAILGLLILAAATVLGVEIAVANRAATTTFDVFGGAVTLPVASLFLLGALVMTVAILGAFMVTGAFQRRRHVRREARRSVAVEETTTRVGELERTNGELVAENDRLRGELAAHQRAEATMGGVAVPAGAGNVAYGDQVSDAVRSTTITDTGRFEPYPVEHGNDAVVNTEAERTDRADGAEKAGILGKFRGTT